MVQLTVKGTKHPDEFLFLCKCSDTCGDLAAKLVAIQNLRHRVRLQLYSASDLQAAAERAAPEVAPKFKERVEAINADTKNPRFIVGDDTYANYWTELRDFAERLFPSECVHGDGKSADDLKAAIDKLYELHENPDIDEDFRLHVYHCRAMLDPDYRPHEALDEATAAMWFAGKLMANDDTIGKYCGNNDKSRLTVKLAAKDGVAPSKEPRVDYNQQRELHKHFAARKEEFAKLEESELRDLAMARAKQERKDAALPPGAGARGEPRLNLDGVRPIKSNAEVTVRDASDE
uniref:Uncharacterized protein n=1 Tax=Neobodo designis TaxID=312471 RepID=A0A7S1Q456_NEODS|mmetsp:Transcript_32416/g.100270  ORF Transcript_32416/g.100270 Transcript_32416/m.100270 type:complete len:290 (+) Transcript_32416:44-913(+)|eukprot:CAMPEP_0174853946 /NCGR_PEP_ID=MMETSP1114-20130205/29650_1 /TAXON_ID=312471 /ORGANISM="Neobodo designis, Strain CCAP 1951/1" /LENGTH=289 /DNA_ID=CAMNT_0016088613 /DNA_START=44 /DNA_END=913 /DNA_ORIENTATION=+